ncbi:hypothetical protein MKX01_029651 [Papaver californicum]|nr:hypothetical protein MKX01_029651 [Papaver californicum]
MNYTTNSTYQTNLNLLLSSLSTTFIDTDTIPRYGYRNITIGRNPNTVYGSLHCREDMFSMFILFYNGCVLRYSDETYFSILNEEPSVVLAFVDNSIANQVGYIDLVTGLLDDLVIEVDTNTSISPSLYATLYAMVQCAPDLTSSLCNRCLRLALGKLPSGAQGARVLFPSCTFRFEYNPFYGNYIYTTQASPPTLQSPSNTTYSDRKDSSRLVVSIAIPLVIAVLLSSIVVWWLCFHKKKNIISSNDHDTDPDIQSAEFLLFDFNIISAANFSEDNKLGQGGFGPVYKVRT